LLLQVVRAEEKSAVGDIINGGEDELPGELCSGRKCHLVISIK